MKISKTQNGNQTHFTLDYTICGKRVRARFGTRQEAEDQWAQISRERKNAGDAFAKLSESEKLAMLMAHELAKENNINLLDVVRQLTDGIGGEINCGEAYRQCIREKRQAGVSEKSISNSSSILERFLEPRWNCPLASITRQDILDWLAEGRTPQKMPWHTRTKIGYLKEIQGFLNWAMAGADLEKNVSLTVTKPRYTESELEEKESRKEILTVKETRRLMDACMKHDPELIPRAALLLFAGPRAEREAPGIRPQDIGFDDNLLFIRPSKAKGRNGRYIEMMPNLIAWLKWADRNEHPLPVESWRARWEDVRSRANLFGDDWPKNAHRHSFASYHLVTHDAKATKTALGHGNYDMLFQHYRSIVKPAEGREYFEIFPPQ